MKYEDLNNLPEYPDAEIIEKLCIQVLEDSISNGIELTIERLDELCDKQWHTYERPSNFLMNRLTLWLRKNWNPNSNEYLLFVLGVSYSFSLSKSLYKEALDNYEGEDKLEFEEAYFNSNQDYIDPWYSLRNT